MSSDVPDPQRLEVHVATLGLLLDCDDELVADLLCCDVSAVAEQRAILRHRYPELATDDRQAGCQRRRTALRTRALYGEDVVDPELNAHLGTCHDCARLLREMCALAARTEPERLPWRAIGLTSGSVLGRVRDSDGDPLRADPPLHGPGH